jgi:hypothetical protein
MKIQLRTTERLIRGSKHDSVSPVLHEQEEFVRQIKGGIDPGFRCDNSHQVSLEWSKLATQRSKVIKDRNS